MRFNLELHSIGTTQSQIIIKPIFTHDENKIKKSYLKSRIAPTDKKNLSMFLEVSEEYRRFESKVLVPTSDPIPYVYHSYKNSSTGNLASAFPKDSKFRIEYQPISVLNYADTERLHGLVRTVNRCRNWFSNKTANVFAAAEQTTFEDPIVQTHWTELITRLCPNGLGNIQTAAIDVWNVKPQRRSNPGDYYAVAVKARYGAETEQGYGNHIQISITDEYKYIKGYTQVELNLFLMSLLPIDPEIKTMARKGFERYAYLMHEVRQFMISNRITGTNIHRFEIESERLTELFAPVYLKSQGEQILEQTVEDIVNQAAPKALTELDKQIYAIHKEKKIAEYKTISNKITDLNKTRNNIQKQLIDLHFKEDELRLALQTCYLNMTRSKADTEEILKKAGIKPENIVMIEGQQYFKIQAPATLTAPDSLSQHEYPNTAQWLKWLKDNKPVRPWFEVIFKVSEFFEADRTRLSVGRPSQSLLKYYTYSPSPHYFFANCDGGAWPKVFNLLAKGAFGPAILMLKANLGSFNLKDSFIVRKFETALRLSALPKSERPNNNADTHLANFYTSKCKISGDDGFKDIAWPLGQRTTENNPVIDQEIQEHVHSAEELRRAQAMAATKRIMEQLQGGR